MTSSKVCESFGTIAGLALRLSFLISVRRLVSCISSGFAGCCEANALFKPFGMGWDVEKDEIADAEASRRGWDICALGENWLPCGTLGLELFEVIPSNDRRYATSFSISAILLQLHILSLNFTTQFAITRKKSLPSLH